MSKKKMPNPGDLLLSNTALITFAEPVIKPPKDISVMDEDLMLVLARREFFVLVIDMNTSGWTPWSSNMDPADLESLIPPEEEKGLA